jgi:hypothetical protein
LVADGLRDREHLNKDRRPEVPKTRDVDNWTISRWKVEPPVRVLDDGFDDIAGLDEAPPLWKDLTLASIVAVLLWLAAAAVFV